jgi:RNA-splicing ligase RtcB
VQRPILLSQQAAHNIFDVPQHIGAGGNEPGIGWVKIKVWQHLKSASKLFTVDNTEVIY